MPSLDGRRAGRVLAAANALAAIALYVLTRKT